MKIEKITLCNLASIEGEYVIDFEAEPLRSAALFAITGDTGAGKSTLLDAICLALYNRAPRFDNVERLKRFDNVDRKQNLDLQPYDTRNILRRGCNEGYAAVEFATPIGARYEARWYVRRKRTDTYDTVARSLKQLSPVFATFDASSMNDRIKEITGLDYEQFTRTVILAQNSFANFLRAKQDEKSALLEKLTGTKIYAKISRKVYQLSEEANLAFAELQAKIEGMSINLLDQTDLLRQQDEKKLHGAKLQLLMATSSKVNNQLLWTERYEKALEEEKKAEVAHTAARKQYVILQTDRQTLERYDLVLPVQPLFNRIKMLEQNIRDGRETESHLNMQIDAESRTLKKIQNELTLAKDKYNEVERQSIVRQPIINKGFGLIGEMNEIKSSVDALERQTENSKNAIDTAESSLNQKQRELEENLAKIENTEQQLRHLTSYQRMFDRFDWVRDKLLRLRVLTQSDTKSRQKLDELNTRRNELNEAGEGLVRKHNENLQKLSAINDQLVLDHLAIDDKNGAELQNSLTGYTSLVQSLQVAAEIWGHISRGYAESDALTLDIQRRKSLLDRHYVEIDRLNKEVEVLTDRNERDRTALNLGQSENIVMLRHQLKEGTPCPVCGGTHHPYHSETERELGELADNLRLNYDESLRALRAKQRQLQQLRDTMSNEIGSLDADKRNLKLRQEELATNVALWQNYGKLDPAIADCSPGINSSARLVMIGQLIDGATNRISETQQALNDYNKVQARINELNKAKTSITNEEESYRDQLQNLRTQLSAISAKIEETQALISSNDADRNETFKEVDKYITITGWFTEWQRSNDSFLTRIDILNKEWKTLQQQTVDLAQENLQLKGDVKAAVVAFNNVSEKYKVLAESLNEARALLEGKTREMRSLFGYSSPADEARALEVAVAEARNAVEAVRVSQDIQNNRFLSLQGQVKHLLESRTNNQERLSASRSELDVWIGKFNGSHSPLQSSELQRLFDDKRNWSDLRAKLKSIDEECLLSENKLTAMRELILKLQSDPEKPSGKGQETQEELLKTKEGLENEVKDVKIKIDLINSTLNAHEKSFEQIQKLTADLAQAKENNENWSRLKSLIGSATGKLFSEQVQSFTFRFLVENANLQLKVLSPRYRLQNIPNSLGLEVIDRDMFDEVRPVTSLSGGETFVVSLALALGLTSLSSDQLAIGSLFIDEGFGNLDNDSLELVMEAMSNLQNEQGRKVGVISHTEQIRNSISPQIRLYKLPTGGRSGIEIR